MTRVFVSSIVSGYSILRTLMALLHRKRISQPIKTTKERREALRSGKSSQKKGTIHFLRTQDSELHLQDAVSGHSQKHGLRSEDIPLPLAAAAQKTAHLRRKGLPFSQMSKTRDATRRADSLSRRRVAMGAGRRASTRLQRGPRRQAILPSDEREMERQE